MAKILRRIWILIRWCWRNTGSADKAGIYITAIAHLAVIIVLLAVQVHTVLRSSNTFLLDFSAQEAEEERIKETEFKESISKRLDELLGDIPVDRHEPQSDQQIRNIAVDAGGHLKDDRNTDVSDLYADAARLERELKSGMEHAIYEDARDEAVEIGKESRKGTENPERHEYTGPSVLSYTLDGRKASHLKIPAYQCYGGGEVTVIITVDPSGRVLNAKVMDDVSSQDQCLRDFAIRAARLSRFSSSRTAPARQTGEIVYRFIAQ